MTTTTISDWLVDAGKLKPGECINIYLWNHEGPPPTFADMRSALHAQYGKDTPIRLWKHGQRIAIFIHDDEEARARYDIRSAPSIIRHNGKRVEIEHGFEKVLD